jgi:TRAP-type C4-dicarboxylate transport system permease small subunit
MTMAVSDAGEAAVRGGGGRRLLPPAPRVPLPLQIFGEIVDWIAIGAGGTIIGLVFVNVVLHLVSLDLEWTTQFCELLMVWVTMLGGAAAGRRGEHVALVELVNLLVPHRLRPFVDGVVQLVAIGVLGSLVWYGVHITETSWDSTMTVLGWSLGCEYLALPVGSACTLVYVLYDFFLILRGVSREERYRLVS